MRRPFAGWDLGATAGVSSRRPDTMSIRSVANDAVMLVFFGRHRDSPPKLEAIRFPASWTTPAARRRCRAPCWRCCGSGRIAEVAAALEPADFGDQVNRPCLRGNVAAAFGRQTDQRHAVVGES